MNPRVAFEAENILGEGPLWSANRQGLYWIDIKGPSLHFWSPSTGESQRWPLPQFVGSMAETKQGDILLALQQGFYQMNLADGPLTHLGDPEPEQPQHRFNDGKCDPWGNFWAGSMHLNESDPVGTLYRLRPSGKWEAIRSGATVSNGLDWSPDRKTMYYTDSGAQAIYAIDIDPSNGDWKAERVLIRDTDCYPDGLAVDSEGFIWGAKWDGWRVVRYAPTGEIDRIIELPIQRPTSVMFGGPDLKQLYITSASDRLSEEELAKQPDAGNLFVIDVEIAGQSPNVFG
ncbi:MAG: SMP-30/gluconolactonase/LRE family protein [Bacteroidota bacterium]